MNVVRVFCEDECSESICKKLPLCYCDTCQYHKKRKTLPYRDLK